MRGKIDIFLPCSDVSTVSPLLSQLRNSRIIQQIVLLVSEDTANVGEAPENTRMVAVDNMFSSKTIRNVAENVQADYAVLTLQQRGRRPDILFDAVDEVIEDIRDVEKIAGRFA